MSALYWALQQIARRPAGNAGPAARTSPTPATKRKPQVSSRGGGRYDYQPKEH